MLSIPSKGGEFKVTRIVPEAIADDPTNFAATVNVYVCPAARLLGSIDSWNTLTPVGSVFVRGVDAILLRFVVAVHDAIYRRLEDEIVVFKMITPFGLYFVWTEPIDIRGTSVLTINKLTEDEPVNDDDELPTVTVSLKDDDDMRDEAMS